MQRMKKWNNGQVLLPIQRNQARSKLKKNQPSNKKKTNAWTHQKKSTKEFYEHEVW